MPGLRAEAEMIHSGAGESIGNHTAGSDEPTRVIDDGVYVITWGGPATLTWVFECSSGAQSFESQGSMEITVKGKFKLTCDIAMTLQKVPESGRLIQMVNARRDANVANDYSYDRYDRITPVRLAVGRRP